MRIKDLKELTDSVNETLPETIKQTDGIVSTLLGFVDNVIFYPLKKANVRFQYKLEQFTIDLKNKTNKIPESNFQEPSLSIIGPTLEALRYTIDEENLREVQVFPPNVSGMDLLMGSPNELEERQLRELHIKIRD